MRLSASARLTNEAALPRLCFSVTSTSFHPTLLYARTAVWTIFEVGFPAKGAKRTEHHGDAPHKSSVTVDESLNRGRFVV